jgi:hypothetical protein
MERESDGLMKNQNKLIDELKKNTDVKLILFVS